MSVASPMAMPPATRRLLGCYLSRSGTIVFLCRSSHMRTFSKSRKLALELTLAAAIALSMTPFFYWAILIWRFYND